jgi:mRNA-degrading endonuclease toxin of MazEF toxin-antitoxin module
MTPSSTPRRGDVYWTALDPARGVEMQKTIRVVDKSRVGDRIVSASEAEMEDIGEAMKMVFAII